MKKVISLCICIFLAAIICGQSYQVVVLGIAQDGGYPQAGCKNACCNSIQEGVAEPSFIASLAIVEVQSGKFWMIDFTPDYREQYALMLKTFSLKPLPEAIFLTHAHIGHYLGLAQLGREVMGANSVPVYAMPRMKSFLESNGPWDQLVTLKNIILIEEKADEAIKLNEVLSIKPFLVPHRDEYSETVGYEITGKKKKLIYIPDIDKWERWNRDLTKLTSETDYMLIDGTFYSEKELPGRNIDEIPHPFVTETAELLSGLDTALKSKVHFIHLNHTNPLLFDEKTREILNTQGFKLCSQGMILDL